MNPVWRVLKVAINSLRRERLQQVLKERLREHDQRFIQMVISTQNDPSGQLHQIYYGGRKEINDWYNSQFK